MESHRNITYKGKVYDTIADASEATGDSYSTIYRAITVGNQTKRTRRKSRQKSQRDKDYALQNQVLKGKFPR